MTGIKQYEIIFITCMVFGTLCVRYSFSKCDIYIHASSFNHYNSSVREMVIPIFQARKLNHREIRHLA